MPAPIATRPRIPFGALPVVAALACAPALLAQDIATGPPRSVESLQPGEMLRLRAHGLPDRAKPVLGQLRRWDGDTLWIVPEPPRPKPLFHRRTPAPYAVAELATVDVGHRLRGGRKSINRGAQQGLVAGVVILALLGAWIGANDGDCGGDGCLIGPVDPWQSAAGGAVLGVTIGPIIGAVAGGVRTSWHWHPVAVRR